MHGVPDVEGHMIRNPSSFSQLTLKSKPPCNQVGQRQRSLADAIQSQEGKREEDEASKNDQAVDGYGT